METKILKKRSATLKEVAERAGVSLMTVSRVLNNRDIVKQDTITKVEAAVEALNYRPNILARSLAGGNSLVIGIVYHNPSSGYLSEILVGAMTACRELGHQLVLEDLSDGGGDIDPEAVTHRLQKMGLDGLLLTPPLSANSVLVQKLHDSNIPTILVGRQKTQYDFSTVSFNDKSAAFAMTQYLIELGHKYIGFIVGSIEQPFSGRRKDGFLQAMHHHNIYVNDALIKQGDYTFKSGMEQGGELLDIKNPPTAIFASNDDMAAGVIAAAHSRNIDIPNSVSIVGFDDTELSSAIWPALTTVRQPISSIAKNSIKLLHDNILTDIPNAASSTIIDTVEIIRRESAAAIK